MSASSDSSSDDEMELAEEQRIAFEHRSDFVYKELLKCAVDEDVHGPQFITRHDCYLFKWRLIVFPKEKDNKLGLYLFPVDRQQNISVEFDLFCGREKEVNEPCVYEFKKRDTMGYGSGAFLPSVESLKEKGLVVDGLVTVGVKITLKVSDFDPLKWITMRSLTPDTGRRIARKHFSDLNAGNRLYSDFTIVVGIGAGKKELYVHKVALDEVPFFKRLFGDRNSTGEGWKENCEKTMALPTFCSGVVKEALRFLYLNEIGQNLTRFGPQLLDLAEQWELTHLKTAIEREMITKLMSDRLNFNLAADYFDLADKYHQKVLRRVAICRLIEMWPKFVDSPKGRNMKGDLKKEVIECGMSSLSGVVIPSE